MRQPPDLGGEASTDAFAIAVIAALKPHRVPWGSDALCTREGRRCL